METPQTPPPVTPQQNWRLYIELIALAGFVIPFGTILGPVILWQMKKDTEAAVKTYGPDVINFHISWLLWSILTCGFGALVYLVFWVIRMVKAANLEEYKAPLTLTLIK